MSGEQVRLCSGHPKVRFGTIVEGSWSGRGEGGMLGGSSGLCHYYHQASEAVGEQGVTIWVTGNSVTGSRVTGSRVTGSCVTGSRVTGSCVTGSRVAGSRIIGTLVTGSCVTGAV